MGIAFDMVGFSRTAGGGGPDAAPVAAVIATGDSATVRNFPQTSKAHLLDLLGQFVTAGAQFQVKSPLLHDNVQGILVIPGETPIRFSFPREADQLLRPQDNLSILAKSNLAAEVVTGALMNYYEDLPGADGRYYNWGDISGNIRSIKPLVVAAPEAGTAGQWNDTVITTSENLLKANTDYAILGYTIDQAEAAIAIKGADLANLRVGGPGDVRTFLTQRLFVDLAERHGMPMIPVINAANKSNTFVSVLSQTTGHTPNVQLILAEMAVNLR